MVAVGWTRRVRLSRIIPVMIRALVVRVCMGTSSKDLDLVKVKDTLDNHHRDGVNLAFILRIGGDRSVIQLPSLALSPRSATFYPLNPIMDTPVAPTRSSWTFEFHQLCPPPLLF
jgi:hypothetical protein